MLSVTKVIKAYGEDSLVLRLLDAFQLVADFQVLPAHGSVSQNTVFFMELLQKREMFLSDLRCEVPIRVREETKSV